MFFRVTGRGNQSSQADYKGGGDYRKLTLKESGGGESIRILQSLMG